MVRTLVFAGLQKGGRELVSLLFWEDFMQEVIIDPVFGG